MSTPRAGVLLDIDGTLVLSNDAHAKAFSEVLREAGYDVPFERVRPLIGMGGDKVLPILTGLDAESPEGTALAARKKALFRSKYLPTLKPAPGAHDLLERMLNEGLTLVIATSASGDEVDGILRQAELDGLVHSATSSSDANRSKPDPDIIHAALRSSGLRPTQVVMLGDTPYDIESAARAGVPTVALRCGGWWSEDDLAAAVAVYDDPADLLRQYDQSPLAGAVARGVPGSA
ncbi:MAG: HAD family hydrolase [Gemmatimonadaceae bacterium]